jgi:arabinose-5-phosphate isomerase
MKSLSDDTTIETLADNRDLIAARNVMQIEAAALLKMRAQLDDSFVRALDLISGASGRVIVSGMGKSGHIGKKIAATMASTGTPAQFVHPAEASHGDLGMITREDVVLCLSNSGGTQELADIIAYTRRFDIPLIAIVGKADSSLGRRSDVCLVLPDAPEACSIGLAPTTSTTASLVMGDALAIALLERKGFSADQFHLFHPGGKLGGALLKVSDLMHTGDSLPLVGETALMDRVLLEMTEKSFGCAGIINREGQLCGIITDGDLRRHMGADLLAKQACEVMTRNPQTISPRSLAAEALAQMNRKGFGGITCLFVAEGGLPVGILNVHDCLRAGVM